jgi:uncharacterized lipoprotein YddW (UPF0748 family)
MKCLKRVIAATVFSPLIMAWTAPLCLGVPYEGFADYRSIFVDRFGDFPYQGDIPSMVAEINAMMDAAADEGFTEIIWQVRGQSDALYNSNVEPPIAGLTPGFDPLQTVLDAAHSRGLKVHAWLNATPLWRGTSTPPDGHSYYNSDPSFRVMDINGNLEPRQGWSNYSTANPILPEMHAHVNNVVSDIMANYAVDGIHLDYIRYIPGTYDSDNFARMPHDPASHQLFFDATGLDGGNVANFQQYKSFLTDRITDLVRSVKENVDAAEIATGRNMELTASVFFEPNRAKNEYAQDFGKWINEGLLDVAMPMIYISQLNKQLYDPYLQSALSFVDPATGTRVAPTIASYLHMNPTRGGGVALTLEQIQSAYNLGAHGVGFYDYPAYFDAYSAADRQQVKNYFDSLAPPEPLPPGAPGNAIDDFEQDEGHFGWAYNVSPGSQTFGLANTTTIDRVTDEVQAGIGSQLLNLASEGGSSWQLRHNSGIGVVADPGSNASLAGTGYVGFWLKTDDSGMSVRLGVDDPVPSGPTALELGSWQNIIADNEWHLYQWNLEDANQWFGIGNPGSDGVIDAVNGTITIDSIWFTGLGDAQIYLDTVAHNPEGPLEAAIPGDYNHDHMIDAADIEAWRSAFGQSASPTFGADGNGDGMVDLADYIIWRKMMAANRNGSSVFEGAVPEPSTLLLVLSLAAWGVLRRDVRSS